MTISKFLKVLVLIGALGVVSVSLAKANEQQHQPESPGGDIPPILQGGEWIDKFSNTGNLATATNVEVFLDHLYLKLEEYLDWTQTYTAHFAFGQFFQTEAISDSVRLAASSPNQYFTSGVFTSTVFDAGKAVDWSSATWTHSGSFYSATLEYRTGNTPTPDIAWSDWILPAIKIGEYYCSSDFVTTDCVCNLSGVEGSRYIQYRATFTSSNPNESLALYDIKLVYGVHHTTGIAISNAVSPIDLLAWKKVIYTATVPMSTSLTIDVLSADGILLVPNVLPGNSLENLDSNLYPSLKVRATFSTTDPSRTPDIDLWGVLWHTGAHIYLPIISR